MACAATRHVNLLAGDWKFATTFNEAGQPVTVTKPLVPVDPATPSTPPSTTDVTTTNYNGFGQADQLWEGTTPTASTRYVIGTSFDDLGRITSRTLSRSTNTAVPALNRSYGYNAATGALAEIKAGWSVSGTVSTWFQHDSYTRDAIGRVTRVDDLGREPAGTASDVKECFIYDQWNRLVRAHSATIATACLTNTSAATVAATSRDPYDTVWAFDDINRMTTSTNKLAGGATTTYVPDTTHPHAVAALTGATTATYEYDLNGAMTSRDGDTLIYDKQQRLTSYASTETYVYTTTNQRLIRQAGGTRTLYLPGMEVSVTGTTRTINCYLTIGATQIGTKTAISGGGTTYAWACGNMQNTNICQTNVYTTAVTPAIPARKRYAPYGADRNAVTFANTDRGFLNQPQDTNGLVYLNNRYHDPTLGHFTSVDPLVGKTGTPYLYGAGNPSSLSDPSGLLPTCATVDGMGCFGDGGGRAWTTGQTEMFVDYYVDFSTSTAMSLPEVLAAFNEGGEDFYPIGPGVSDDEFIVNLAFRTAVANHYLSVMEGTLTPVGESAVDIEKVMSPEQFTQQIGSSIGIDVASVAGPFSGIVVGSYRKVRGGAPMEGHHVYQNAALEGTSGVNGPYRKNPAIAVSVEGPPYDQNTPHGRATAFQKSYTGPRGTVWNERRVARGALRAAGFSQSETRYIMRQADLHLLRTVGMTWSTTTNVPGSTNKK